jgi:O-antigen ligase
MHEMLDRFGLHPWTVTLRPTVHVSIDLGSGLVYLLVAVAAFLATRRRPAYGIAVLIVATPLGLARYVAGTSITLEKVALAGFMIALALSRPFWAIVKTVPVRRIAVALACALAAIAFSAFAAEYRVDVAREFLKWVEYALVFGACALAFGTDPDERPIWRGIVTAGTIVVISALAQYVVGANAGIFVHGSSVPRIAGVLEGPNQLSGYLGLVLPLALARNLLRRDGRLVAFVIVLAVTDVLTLSRSGIVAAAVGCTVVFLVMRPPRVVRTRTVAGAVALVGLVVFLAVRAGFSGDYFSLNPVPQPADHLGNRAILWHAAIVMWEGSPIVGVGAGNYEERLPDAGAPGIHTHANSIYLQSLAEGGVIMLATTIGIFATIIVTLGRGRVRIPIVTGALAATVGFAVHQIYDDLVFFPKVGVMWWILVGLAAGELARRAIRSQRLVSQTVAA